MEARPHSWLLKRAWIRRIVRAGLRVALGLLILLGVLTALVAHQASTLVHAGAVAEAKRFGERIGRTITVGPAHVEIGAVLSVQLDDIRILAAPGQEGPAAAPLAEVAALRVKVPAWSILRSFGKDLEVRAIEARGPVLRLVRLAGGELSYTDVALHLAAAEPRAETGRRARIGMVQVTGARVELHDLSHDVEHGGVHLAVDRLDASVPEIRTEAPLDLSLDAAVLAPERNLHLELGFSPRTEPVTTGALGHLRRAEVRLSAVVVDPLVPFIPVRGGFSVAGATVSADLALAVDPRGPISLRGSVAAAALRLVHDAGGHEEALGSPVDVTARADVAVDPLLPSLEVRSLEVSAGGMTVEGHADVRGPVGAPEVRALDVHTRDVTFERLLSLVPPARMPAGVSLSGPIELRAKAHGPPRAAEIDVAADLAGAEVTLPELRKPPGVPLSAELVGRVRREQGGDAGGLEIDSLGGPLALTLKGRVRSATDVDLTFDSGEVTIEPLLRLLPAVARGVPAGAALAGQIQASGHVKRSGTETHAEARVALRRAGVKTAALTLEGAADLVAQVHAVPGSTTFTADLDAAGARAQIPGRLDKAAGAPLSVHAQVERAGAVTTVREARLSLSGATVSGRGRHDTAAHTLTVDAPVCELDLAALARAVPALGNVPAALRGARLRANVSLSGDPRALGAAHLHLTDLDVSAPFGRVRGLLDLRGLSPVHAFTVDLTGDLLDLDGLSGGSGGGLPPIATAGAVEGRGKLHLGRLRARGLDARDVDAEITLERGVLTLPTLRLSTFGGHLLAGGSHVDLAHGPPAFALRARAERIDLAAMTVARGGSASDLSGRLDAEISLDGAGVDWAAISPTLAGTVKVSIDGAHVHGKHTMRGTIVNPLIGKLAERARKKHPVREVDTHIERATVALRVAGGRVTTTSPLVTLTDEGTVTIDGTVGFDRSLSLTGSVVIPPAAIEKATKGLLVPYGDATLKLRIDGTSEAPRIELVDLESTVKALRGSWIHGIEKKIERALGKE